MKRSNRDFLIQAPILFVHGAVFHLLLFAAYLHYGYRPTGAPSFLKTPFVYISTATIGGLWFAAVVLHLLKSLRSSEPILRKRFLFWCGVGAIVATVLTVATASVLGAARGSLHLASDHSFGSLVQSTIYLTVDISTYALIPATYGAPFSFLSGILAGAYLSVISRRAVGSGETVAYSSDGSKLSLVLGILSLIFFFVPLVGVALGIAAVVCGIRAWHLRTRHSVAPLVFATIGIMAGAFCACVWVSSFVFYQVLFRHR
jgi:hypothetical protein